MRILTGTCAFTDHDDFYPKSIPVQERLRYYAKYFPVVEIDTTFYGFVEPDTWRRWVSLVPMAFRFHVKAHGAMTLHVSNLSKDERIHMTKRFLANLEPVRERGQLGAILLQFPPWFNLTHRNKAIVERMREHCRDDAVAVEFRERSWFADDERTAETLHFLRDIDTIHVVCDEPQKGKKSVPFVPEVTHAKLGILRMHGRNAEMWDKPGLTSSKERFHYRYTTDELTALLPSVMDMSKSVEEFHILMNNNSNNDAVWNGFDWMDLLHTHIHPRPDLLASKQLRLLNDTFVEQREG